MFSEDDLLPISALQHLLFCERQCALIHIEGLWDENWLTVEGRHLHEKAHEGPSGTRGTVRIARGLLLRSFRLGLIGKADVVEFYPPHEPDSEPWRSRAVADGVDGLSQAALYGWRAFPIEYKRGRPKRDESDRVQLCGQALCLEEMRGVKVPSGALFYGRTRRRLDVAFEQSLRALTEETAARLHALIASRRTPRAVREVKCDRCSLLHLCLPAVLKKRVSAARYLERSLQQSLESSPPEDCDE